MRFAWMWAGVCAVALGANPRLDRAIELPEQAQALRDQGVPADEVARAVRASREHGLSAADAADVLDEAKGGGKLDNLGSFVKAKLDEGLRGRELAEAIHAEKARRGKGPPDGHGPRDDHGPDDKGGKAPHADGDEGGNPHADGDKGGNPHTDAGKSGKGKSGKGGR